MARTKIKIPNSGNSKLMGSGRIGPKRNTSGTGIVADVAPSLAPLNDASTPAAAFTAGTYSSPPNTISSQTAVYLVDGAPQLGTYDLTAGEVVQVREDVVDSAGGERSFVTTARVVQPSVTLSNTAVPTINQAVIGSVSTATTGTWAGSAARTYSYQWQVNGVNVGTDASTYTPQPADDGLDLTVTVTANDGFTQVPASSIATAVTYTAPVAAGGLIDRVYDIDVGVMTVDASTDFTNAVGGTWSVNVATGISIDQSGIVSIDTATAASGTVTATYTNSGGSDSSAFSLTIGIAPILTTPTASADGQNGVKTLSVITDTANGTLVASTYPAADTPTAPAIELGTGAAITDSKTVTATGLQTFPAGTGLDPITPYKVWYVHRSAAGQLSEAVASATFYTDPGVYAAAGVADIQVNDGLDNPTVVVTVGGVEVFNGPLALLNLQADAYALVDPAIGVVGGGDPATDSTLEDLDDDVWTFDPAINPAPTPTRQWDSDGAPIGGATASTYALTASETDTDMTLDKTLLAVPATSNTIVIPPAAFDPVTDLANLVGVWDAGDEASITDTGGQVTQIADLSAAGTNLTNTASPAILTGVAADDINGRNVLSFAGSRTLTSSGAPLLTDNYEMMLLIQPGNITNKDLLGTGGTTNGDILVQIGGSVGNTFWTSSGAQGVTGPSVSLDEVLIAHVYVDGTTIYAGKNGVGSTGTVAGTKSGLSKNIVLGARISNHAYAFVGGAAYGAITDTPWSVADKNALGQYLAALGGISWTTIV